MDPKNIMGESSKVITVVNAIRNDPSLLKEFKTNPQEAMSKIGVELNEEELGLVQKLGGISEFKDEVENIFNTVKGWLGFKDKDPH